MMICEMCGVAINPKTDAYYQHVCGWAKVRSQGGTNQVSAPVRDQTYACAVCIHGTKELQGQLEMFGG